MELNSYKKILRPIQLEMEEVEKQINLYFHNDIPLLKTITDHVFQSGGKRIRPAMVLFSAGVFEKKTSSCIQAAMAIEFFHAATLIHDDVVDNADLRRNQPTVNIKWSKETAVLIGDCLYTQAFKILSEINDLKMMNAMAICSAITAKGEIFQLVKQDQFNLKSYNNIIFHKTAKLLSTAMSFGGILAEADAEQLNYLSQAGLNMGYAFQIIDDTLDYFQSTIKFGKNAGKDLEEKKITLPIIHLIEVGTVEEQEQIKSIFQAKQYDKTNFKTILKLCKKYHTQQYCIEHAQKYIDLALQNLSQLPQNDHTESIKKLSNYIIKRVL